MKATRLNKSVVWAVLIALTVLGPMPARAAIGPDIEQQRSELSERLVEMGATPELANQAVGQLTAEDVSVFHENPQMIQSAGTLSNEEAIMLAFGVTIVVLLIIIAA